MPQRPTSLVAGATLDGRYLLRRPIGAGAMAEVWEARDEQQGRDVAVKVLSEGLAPSEHARLRFEREVQVIGKIHHPNVVSMLGHGATEDGRAFLVMELARGESLAAYLKRTQRLGERSTLVLADQMLAGLGAAHEQGILHRDLKPANILLAELASGAKRVKLVDFGMARVLDLSGEDPRLTRTGTVLGSPRYMSLEVLRASPDVDARADLFSIGAVVYRCLAGEPPFTGAGLGAVMLKILHHDIPPLAGRRPDLRPRTLAFVERALAQAP